MIARRTRLAFLNVQAADEALPRIIEIMGKKLKWSEQKKKVWRGSWFHNQEAYENVSKEFYLTLVENLNNVLSNQGLHDGSRFWAK